MTPISKSILLAVHFSLWRLGKPLKFAEISKELSGDVGGAVEYNVTYKGIISSNMQKNYTNFFLSTVNT